MVIYQPAPVPVLCDCLLQRVLVFEDYHVICALYLITKDIALTVLPPCSYITNLSSLEII